MTNNYTLAEWMNGVAPRSKVRKYIYGIGIDANDELFTFISKRKKPKRLIQVFEEFKVKASIEDIKPLRKELFLKYKDSWAEKLQLKKAEEELYKSRIGRIAIHSDNCGIHKAVVLEPTSQAFALFLTSHPDWAGENRLLTEYERSLCGLVHDQIETFFAPVVRPLKEFSFTERQFSESRVIDLLNEFHRNNAN